MGRVMPVVSASWKASLPMSIVFTCPVIASMGTLSKAAVAMPVTRLVAPGPLVDEAHAEPPRRARVTVGRVGRALLVAGQHDLDRRLVEDVENRAARTPPG